MYKEQFTKVVLIKNGDTLKTWTNNSYYLQIKDSLVCDSGDYFYVIISQQDGDQAISSPIFVGKKETDVLFDSGLEANILFYYNNICIENTSNDIIRFQIIDLLGKVIQTGVLKGYDNIRLNLQKNETIIYVKVYNNKGFKVYKIVY